MASLIVKLPDSTIQMIAAGEVITRPVNVIKELLENSLDADSTNVRIIIEQGGMKSIEIIDNGHGIARANAELLCRRYTTSKLKIADDLSRIETFGFRGEALSSVSEVADIEVKTFNMTSDKMGWHAKYKSGELVQPPVDKYIQSPGTHLKVTNLFSNIRQRRSAMQTSIADEKKAIIDLVMRTAIHHRDKVTMSLKETSAQDLICLLAPMSIEPCIGMFFGLDMESNMLELEVESNDRFKTKAKVVLSYKKSTGSNRQSNFILFVNNRLVECPELKKDIEAVLNDFLNFKQNDSLTYVTLEVPSRDVDVNTHPAKSTVALHYQADIVSLIVVALREKLWASFSSQTINQSTSTQAAMKLVQYLSPRDSNSSQGRDKPVSQKRSCPYDIVHNDSTQQTLSQLHQAPQKKAHKERREIKLLSISQLKKQVSREQSLDTARIIKNSVFVGLFDHDRALIQHETKLYAINLKSYLKEQYYQFYLFDFGNFPPIEILPPGNKIKFIIETYLGDIKKHDSEYYKKLKFNTFDLIIEKLLKHLPMYQDYLTLKLTKDEILTIPCIMPDEIPNLTYLGKFLVDLVEHVDYSEERECFRTMGRVLADFYSEAPSNLKDRDVHRRYHDVVEKKLYVAIRNYLLVPEWLFVKENICQISDTKDLYKVFERC